jgi:hypothetical protein
VSVTWTVIGAVGGAFFYGVGYLIADYLIAWVTDRFRDE